MGTNYYARFSFCTECERYNEVHLGKFSAGWRFAIELHTPQYNNWKEFEEFIQKKDVEIFDEYGKTITANELLKKIEDVKDKKKICSDGDRKVINDEFADLCCYDFS